MRNTAACANAMTPVGGAWDRSGCEGAPGIAYVQKGAMSALLMIALAAMCNGTHAVPLAQRSHVSPVSAKDASPGVRHRHDRSSDHAIRTNQRGSNGSNREESLSRCNETETLIELHRRLGPTAEAPACLQYEPSPLSTKAYWERS
jgi:hypothetical protein